MTNDLPDRASISVSFIAPRSGAVGLRTDDDGRLRAYDLSTGQDLPEPGEHLDVRTDRLDVPTTWLELADTHARNAELALDTAAELCGTALEGPDTRAGRYELDRAHVHATMAAMYVQRAQAVEVTR